MSKEKRINLKSPIILNGTKYRTVVPIALIIYREENYFFAENEKLSICGTGSTDQEALRDFCQHLLYFYEYYRDINQEKLTGDAVRLKELYKNLLIEE